MSEKAPDTTPITLFEEIFPGDTNAYGTAFGGKILALMDRAAGLAAARFGRSHFVTASLDAMEFRAPVQQGEIAEVEATVVYTSAHTAGIKVHVYAVDKIQWNRRLCCQGMIFMVAIGEGGRPRTVPVLQPRDAQQQQQWTDAQAIHQAMLARRGRGG